MKNLQCLWKAFGSSAQTGRTAEAESLYGFVVDDIDGKPVSLSQFKGQVLLIVNVASRCGFTRQYEGLEKLYRRFKEQGFAVLGFPANNFLWQEPGSNQQIKSFCSARYQVSFPMFSKISVRGRGCSPLYQWLVNRSVSKRPVEWNFAKFLISRKGQVIGRFCPAVKPEDDKLLQAIISALADSA